MEISKEEYLRLKICEARLLLLEQGGVDNWEWYSYSLNPDFGEESISTIAERLTKEILGDQT